jgi:hypothetical protein
MVKPRKSRWLLTYLWRFEEIFGINPFDFGRVDENAGDGDVVTRVDDLLRSIGKHDAIVLVQFVGT